MNKLGNEIAKQNRKRSTNKGKNMFKKLTPKVNYNPEENVLLPVLSMTVTKKDGSETTINFVFSEYIEEPTRKLIFEERIEIETENNL